MKTMIWSSYIDSVKWYTLLFTSLLILFTPVYSPCSVDELDLAKKFVRKAEFDKGLYHTNNAIALYAAEGDDTNLAKAYFNKAAILLFLSADKEQAMEAMCKAVLLRPCLDVYFVDYMKDPRVISLRFEAEFLTIQHREEIFAQALFHLKNNETHLASEAIEPYLSCSENPIVAQIQNWIESSVKTLVKDCPEKDFSSDRSGRLNTPIEKGLLSPGVQALHNPVDAVCADADKVKRVGIIPFDFPNEQRSKFDLQREFRSGCGYEIEIIDAGNNKRFMQNYGLNEWADFVVRPGQISGSIREVVNGEYTVGRLRLKHADAMRYLFAMGGYDLIVAIQIKPDDSSYLKALKLTVVSYSPHRPDVPINRFVTPLLSTAKVTEILTNYIEMYFN